MMVRYQQRSLENSPGECVQQLLDSGWFRGSLARAPQLSVDYQIGDRQSLPATGDQTVYVLKLELAGLTAQHADVTGCANVLCAEPGFAYGLCRPCGRRVNDLG